MVTWLSDGNRLYNLRNVDVVKLVSTKTGEKGILLGIVDMETNTIVYNHSIVPIKKMHYTKLVVSEVNKLLGQGFILVKKKSDIFWYNKMSIKMIEFTPKAGSIAMVIYLIGGIKVDARTFKTPSEANAYLFEMFSEEMRNGNITSVECNKKGILKVLSV